MCTKVYKLPKFWFKIRRDHKKISYERRDYESVARWKEHIADSLWGKEINIQILPTFVKFG